MKSFSSTSFANATRPRCSTALLPQFEQASAGAVHRFPVVPLRSAATRCSSPRSRRPAFDKDGLSNLVADMVALAPQLTPRLCRRPAGPAVPQAPARCHHLGRGSRRVRRLSRQVARQIARYLRAQRPAAVPRHGRRAPRRAGCRRPRLDDPGPLEPCAARRLRLGAADPLAPRPATASCPTSPTRSASAPGSGKLRGWVHDLHLHHPRQSAGAAKEKPWGFKTLALKRHRLRLLANKLGVRQRSLMFALVTHALNGEGADKHMSKKVIGAAYTMLDGKRHDADDDFFRVRALEAKFKVLDDFVALCARGRRHRRQDRAEGHHQVPGDDELDVPARCAACNRALPFLPGKRFWRFNGGIHVVLTLVPPHRTYGPMTHGMIEPIYCGAWHPAANICTFCPGREYVTLNFSMETRHIANVDKISRCCSGSRRWTSRRRAARWWRTTRSSRATSRLGDAATASPVRLPRFAGEVSGAPSRSSPVTGEGDRRRRWRGRPPARWTEDPLTPASCVAGALSCATVSPTGRGGASAQPADFQHHHVVVGQHFAVRRQ